tara:strand:+ start:225 stop:500 length:276 start_codon:yes stop_codon:yes gene_type:complete
MATKKLDKEHLEQIQQLRDNYSENSAVLGNIAVERFQLNMRLEEIAKEEDKRLQDIASLKQQETDLVVKLRERYGEGEINVEAGTFTDVEV